MASLDYPINKSTSIAWYTGLLSGIAAASDTNGCIMSLRWSSTTTALLVHRVRIEWATTTAFTAAQEVGLDLRVARSFTAIDTGGIGCTPMKLWTKGSTLSGAANISDTAQLTAGTFATLVPKNTDEVLTCWHGEVAVASNILGKSFAERSYTLTDGAPLRIEANEGLRLRNMVAMGAGGVARVMIQLDVTEVLV